MVKFTAYDVKFKIIEQQNCIKNAQSNLVTQYFINH